MTSWIITTPTIGENSTWPSTQTQIDQPEYYTSWHLVWDRDDCTSIHFLCSSFISLPDLFAWNPALGTDCSGLYFNHWVCVGIQPQTTGTVNIVPLASPTEIVLPPLVSWTSSEPFPTLDPRPHLHTPNRNRRPVADQLRNLLPSPGRRHLPRCARRAPRDLLDLVPLPKPRPSGWGWGWG